MYRSSLPEQVRVRVHDWCSQGVTTGPPTAGRRSAVIRKIDGLPDEDLRTSRLPSGWTPLELVKHLVYMEKRWFQWGFAAEQIPAPWGYQDADGRWRVGPQETVADLVAAFVDGATGE